MLMELDVFKAVVGDNVSFKEFLEKYFLY